MLYLDEIASHPNFKRNRTTVLYIHGFRDNVTSEGVKTVMRAFIYRKEFNVLALNWSVYASGNYITNAIPNLIRVAQLMGLGVYTLFKYQVIDVNKLHGESEYFGCGLKIIKNLLKVIGHSLGAQMSGYIGRWIIALSRRSLQLYRISALDPALPLFYTNFVFLPMSLSSRDAEYVDVYHTDAGVLGANVPSGTVDIWMNGGSEQPGCNGITEPICSHSRAWQYFAESTGSNHDQFYARKCKSYEEFERKNCSFKEVSIVGLKINLTIKGNFYLQTNSYYPFAKGIGGATYSEHDNELEKNIINES